MGNTNKVNLRASNPSLGNDNVAAKPIQSLVSSTLRLNLNSSKNNTIRYPEVNDELLEILPLELWEEILMFVEDNTLACNVPRISRLLYHLSSENSNIWKQKSLLKYGSSEKEDQQSWKDFYLIRRT